MLWQTNYERSRQLPHLEEIATSIESGFACSKSKLVAKGLPHLRPFNISGNGDLDFNEVYQIPESEAPNGKSGLRVGDVLFNNTNSAELVGKAAYVPTNMDAGFSNHVTRLRFDLNRVEPQFVTAYLRHLWQRRYFQRNCTQWVSQAAFNSEALRQLEVPLPPIAEQRRIVDILNCANGIRRLRREALVRSSQLISTLFVEMFGDPISNAKGWKTYKFHELYAERPNYGTMIKPIAEDTSWLDIRVANIVGDQLDLTNRKYVELPSKDIKRHTVEDGDLLIARAIGSLSHLGKCVVARPGSERWAFDSHVMRVRLQRDYVVPEYVHAFLNSPGGREIFLKNTRSSAVQFNINTKEFGQISIPVPPIALQRGFVTDVVDVQSIIAEQERASLLIDQLVVSSMAQYFER